MRVLLLSALILLVYWIYRIHHPKLPSHEVGKCESFSNGMCIYKCMSIGGVGLKNRIHVYDADWIHSILNGHIKNEFACCINCAEFGPECACLFLRYKFEEGNA